MSDIQTDSSLPTPADNPAIRPTASVKKKQGLISSTVADIIGGISSMAVGGVTAWRLIEERVYKNLSSLHLLGDLKEYRQEEGKAILRKFSPLKVGEDVKDQTVIDRFKEIKDNTQWKKELSENYLLPEEAGKQLEALVQKYDRLSDERMAQAGIKNLWQKWRKLRPHQQGEILVTSAAYGGIALGSILLFTRSLLSSKENEKDSGPQQPVVGKHTQQLQEAANNDVTGRLGFDTSTSGRGV